MEWRFMDLTLAEPELRAWSNLTNLTDLKLWACHVESSTMEVLASALTALTSLQLHLHDTASSKVMAVARLTSLQSLDIRCPGDPYEHITHLSSLTALTHLTWDPYNRDINLVAANQAIGTLRALTNLRQLHLPCLQLDDEGLQALAQLTQLTDLALASLNIRSSCPAVALSRLLRLNLVRAHEGPQPTMVRRLVGDSPALQDWESNNLDVSRASNGYPDTAEGLQQLAADVRVVMSYPAGAQDSIDLWEDEYYDGTSPIGPVLGALAPAAAWLRTVGLWNMRLARACLQQLSEACPQLTRAEINYCTLDLGTLLGLLPLANNTAHQFENGGKGAGERQGFGLLVVAAEVTLFCTQVQTDMVLGFDPEGCAEWRPVSQALQTLLETYQSSIKLQPTEYFYQ
eukprot:CAMPEP_0202899008 /NCGR_PEP_ID=MMETSP1392-20130828/7370_1 /ASSEMBLY_ACC=CAM_ASM_000868 /TAXON_ID=225041 /ORGANISM="Chlamydomonas chlamydogama, Strain SAG 11-48b" /LENGTH=400 /DNA_ID=CAMNT_0049585091 /DNA_START=522 /DNA_END=1725 /DNA_ORIENTATION=-